MHEPLRRASVLGDVLLGLLVANGIVFAVRFWVAADAYAIAARERRRALGLASPIVAGISLAALAFVTVTPHALVGCGTWLAHDTIETVFAEEEPQNVLTPEQLAAATVATPFPSGTGEALAGDRPLAEPEGASDSPARTPYQTAAATAAPAAARTRRPRPRRPA